MDLEYYKIDQAARTLACAPDEVEHLLETGKLHAHLYSNSKKFVVIERQTDRLIARGIATYRGLIKINQSYVQPLLHNKKITITSYLALLEPANIRYWNTTHSFKSDLFLKFLNISEWIPYEGDFAKSQKQLLALPLPDEGLGTLRMLSDAINSITKDQESNANLDRNHSHHPKYLYSFSKQGSYAKSDIRITHEDLMDIGDIEKLASPITIITENDDPLPWCSSKKKHSRIDRAVERALRAYPKQQSKALWRALLSDYELDDPLYDKEQIIQVMDDDSIEWLNSEKYKSELQFKSFINKVSLIRKFYRENNLL